MEMKQAFVLFGMLSFLGTVCVVVGTAVVVICARVIGEDRLSRFFSVGSGWLFGGRGLAWKIIDGRSGDLIRIFRDAFRSVTREPGIHSSSGEREIFL